MPSVGAGYLAELRVGAAHGGRPARQVTAGIADQLRASGPGERRRITLLFCDVQDSTATAEQLDPEEWADIMRGALSRSSIAFTARICAPSLVWYSLPAEPHQSQQPLGL